MSGTHPSDYAIDRAVLGAPVDPALAAHLGGCARCRGAVAARRTAASAPGWLDRVRVAAPRAARWWRRWWIPLPALAAVTAAFVLYLPAVRGGADGTREKGVPRVVVYLKRGDTVEPWDGRAAVRAGDRLRVAVLAPGFTHLSVASVASVAPGDATVLHAGPLATGAETLLPQSFRVDAAGDAEVLSVVVARHAIDHAEHLGAARATDAWSTRIVIPKEAQP